MTGKPAKVKSLMLRLDIETHRRLQKAMRERDIGWQTLGESLVKIWLLSLEGEKPPRQPVDETFAFLLPRQKRATLALGESH